MTVRIDALVLPGDEPIDPITLKKHLLFFDSLTLANPADAALINSGDVVEKFPDMTLIWESRNQFPRSKDFVEKLDLLLKETSTFQNRGILKLTPKTPSPNLDPGVDHTIWHSAIADEVLVKAAVPDCHSFIKPPLGIEGYIYNLVAAQGGYKSKYSLDWVKPSYKIDGIDEAWSYFAHLRLARFLKFIRKAHGQGLVPISNDAANSSMLNSVSRTQSLFTEKFNDDPEQIATLAFSMDVFEPESLNKVLVEMSWKDIERLRKETLPSINVLREHVIISAKKMKNSNLSDLNMYRDIVTKLNADYENKREKVAEEWEKLRIAAIAKFGGVIGTGGIVQISGLIGTTMANPWADILFKVLCGSLIATAGVSAELKTLLPAKNALKQHPLYFTESIVKR